LHFCRSCLFFIAVFNEPVLDPAVVACPHCDLLQRLPTLEVGASARCARCDAELWRRREESLERPLALAVACAVLYVIANTAPMLGLEAVGRTASTTVIGGALQLWGDGREIVAALVLFTAVVAPALQILFMLAIAGAARRERAPRWVGALLRHHPITRTWSMIEVMMVGVLVALIKIAELATVIPGTALYALGALIFLLAAMQASFDPREVWRRIEWADASAPRRMIGAAEVSAVIPSGATALQRGLQSCESCGLVSRPAPGAEEGRCPRCGEHLRFRKAASLQRTWAYLFAAAICYAPANLLPVLTTSTAAGSESDTILEGVVLLWSPTGWPLSLIVLIASILIPSAKILTMAFLLVTVQRGSLRSNEQRVRLYRTVELIGRWSMVDVFVDTFTAALVQLQPLMSVEPAAGLLFFAAVVVLTMLAVESFDPRSIWDPQGSRAATAAEEVQYA
jgi:paraquat-inducible protein A